ncbi:MAG: DNA alkylation repair enzyme [candidate division WS2 bacterium ADurb.Bin280]|uniref:DNA alkylation repair enzyme n=1 Tax=candidate division WS2 bacterium ADurb.Bin280 TaxID=1852829 RepID=A0A1V5SFJ3_9BACT|nr:MAG: DNA alkylation repair enzyme [candidate division WS2 bacterium ADurb.Bin280]
MTKQSNKPSAIAHSIKSDLQNFSQKISEDRQEFVKKYLGTKRNFLNIKSPSRDKVLRKYKKQLNSLEGKELLDVLDILIKSDTFDFLNFAGKFISFSKSARQNIDMHKLEEWLEKTTGWAECDSLCQSLFEGNEAIERFEEFKKTVEDFSISKNIQLRRASLVLQVKPTRQIKNRRLENLSFETIDRLKKENHILITKAVSWLLRSLTTHYRFEVESYLLANKEKIPSIAYRETTRKLKTGKK